MWTDSHCHLQYDGIAGDALERAAQAGVERVICVGTDAEQSKAAIDAAAAAPGRVWATVGVHPHEAKHGTDGILPLLDAPGVVAVGECGLDYYYDHSPRDLQRAAFAAQIALARIHDLALVVHTRDAWDETFELLNTERAPERVVFHCFTGGPGEARRALQLGGYLSFSGIVTFAKADEIRAAAKMCPVEKLLIETDAPYLAPVPHRGEKNQPSYVTVVGRALAELRGVDEQVIRDATTKNATAAFNLR